MAPRAKSKSRASSSVPAPAPDVRNVPFRAANAKNSNTLSELGISLGGYLSLKPSLDDEVARLASLPKDGLELPASEFGNLLGLLQRTFESENESGARVLINGVLARVSAMIGKTGSHQMVVITEDYVPKKRMTKNLSLSGIIDYSIVLRKPEDIGQSRWNVARPKENTRDFGFLSLEAKSKISEPHESQVICEMLMSGQSLDVDYIRGAVTDGMNWKFFLLRLRDDLYLKSNSISLGAGPEYPNRDLIAGLLFHWIKKGRMDLDREDWFTAVPGVPTDKMPAPIRHTVRFRTVRFASLMQAVSVVIIAVLCWVILTTRSQGGTCG